RSAHVGRQPVPHSPKQRLVFHLKISLLDPVQTLFGEEYGTIRCTDNRLHYEPGRNAMPTVKKYRVTPLKFDAKLAQEVAKRRTGGESIAAIAKSLKLGAGKVAMCELI